MNIIRWLFSKEGNGDEAEVAVEEEAVDEPVEDVSCAPCEHDERATAAEEKLAKAMEEIACDGFDEQVQRITIGTQSLSEEQVRTALKGAKLNSHPGGAT